MELRLLIDGYNLLFATGAAQPRGKPVDLTRARERLLGQLAKVLDAQQRSATHIVFDAGSGRKTAENTQVYQGMLISFASDYAEADDLLEQLIRQHPQPRKLTVISSDVRIQRCARSRKASWLTCDQWLMQTLEDHGWQETARWPQHAAAASQIDTPNEKPTETRESLAPEDVTRWLREFGWTDDHDRA
jgi:uncharacterized protein